MGLQALLSDFGAASRQLEQVLVARQTDSADSWIESASIRRQELEIRGATAPDEPETATLQALVRQLNVLNNTIRLSCSAIHSDPQMLAPQLIGRLAPLVRLEPTDSPSKTELTRNEKQQLEQPNEHLARLLDQCDQDGSLDCALLPVDHCLQAPDGLQLSSLEGHLFAIMSMVVAADRRHLLAVSNRFIMWDISTGEISRDIDPKIGGSIMRQLKMGLNNEYALAFTSNDLVLALDILTQQVSWYKPELGAIVIGDESQRIVGLDLVDKVDATLFVIWTKTSWFVLRLLNNETLNQQQTGIPQRLSIELEYTFSLDSLEQATQLSLSSVAVIKETQHQHIILLTTFDASSLDAQVRLHTLMASKDSFDRWTLKQWQQSVGGCSLALSASLNRVVFASSTGDLYLSRMRASSWSRPKLLHRASDEQSNPTSLLESEPTQCPLAVEVDSAESERPGSDWSTTDATELATLAEFERQVDALHSSDSPDSIRVVRRPEQTGQPAKRPSGGRLLCNSGISFIRLYLARRVDVLRLTGKVSGCQVRRARLEFPQNLRNISVEPNKCQVKSIILAGLEQHYLAASIGRRILIYSLESEQCLRSIEDAHGARIVELAPISSGFGGARPNVDSSLCFASASMDRSVKIWNLANLNKDIHSLTKLTGAIECLSVAAQWQHQQQQQQKSREPQLAACLSRSELGVWDWPSGRLLVRLSANEQSIKAAGRFVKCRFSRLSGRYLSVATEHAVRLYTLEFGSKSPGAQLELRLCFERRHPAPGLVRRLAFFLQDSRLLVTLECLPSAQVEASRGSQEECESPASSQSSHSSRLTHRLLVLCYSLPDGRLLFTIDHLCPALLGGGAESHYLAQSRSNDEDAPARTAGGATRAGSSQSRARLPVLTRDQLHLVCMELDGAAELDMMSRKSSAAAARLPLLLGVYSARDGRPVRTINLSQLELYNAPHDQRLGQTVLQVSIGNEQFTRLKAVGHRERQSVVALIDDERSQSFLVDVQSRQLVARLSFWNGKLSSDARYGLSRVFKVAALADRSGRQSSSTTQLAAGLQLLEMRRGSPIKALLTSEQLAELAVGHSAPTGPPAGSMDLQRDVICGFTKPNDAYVYYCDSRLKRLLLVRLRDNQLVANYKLSTAVRAIKCAADGYALLLAQTDGALSALAIVDSQRNDSLVRLKQYPSRAHRGPPGTPTSRA